MNKEEIKILSKRVGGKNTEAILKALSRTNGFVAAFNNPLGQELLNDGVKQMGVILEKIINEETTPQELADFRAYRRIISKWVEIINTHKENIKKGE